LSKRSQSTQNVTRHKMRFPLLQVALTWSSFRIVNYVFNESRGNKHLLSTQLVSVEFSASKKYVTAGRVHNV
jgi:hypothetical protein